MDHHGDGKQGQAKKDGTDLVNMGFKKAGQDHYGQTKADHPANPQFCKKEKGFFSFLIVTSHKII